MADDMDVNAGRILEGRATLDEVGREIYDLVLRVGSGEQTKSEALGPPGVHPDLQTIRADRPGLPGALSVPARRSGEGEGQRRCTGACDIDVLAFCDAPERASIV